MVVLLLLPLFVGVLSFVFVLSRSTLDPFQFCNHHDGEERASWLLYLSLVTVSVLWLFLMVPWVGLQWVIVVFTDYTDYLKGQDEVSTGRINGDTLANVLGILTDVGLFGLLS